MSEAYLWAAIAAAVIIAAALWGTFRRLGPHRDLRRVLDRIAYERLEDVDVPDGLGGMIHLEQVLLTHRGILIIETRSLDGMIFAGERLDQWSAMHDKRRHTFDNPMPAVRARIASVRALAPDTPVHGRVVFLGEVAFPRGAPTGVTTVDGLLEEFRPDEHEEPGRGSSRAVDAFYPQWETLGSVTGPSGSRSDA